MTEAERWLAWLDGDRKNDGTRQMPGTPYQTAQRIAKRLCEAPDNRNRATAELLEYLADLVSRGALYTGYRLSGSNERYTYEHLVFKVPR